jgi:hypothetical protein
MTLPNGVVGCDFCENTSVTPGRVVDECDGCEADCCSACSATDPEDYNRVLCAPGPESGTLACAPEEWE